VSDIEKLPSWAPSGDQPASQTPLPMQSRVIGEKPPRRKGPVVAAVIVGLLLLGGIGAGALFLFRSGDATSTEDAAVTDLSTLGSEAMPDDKPGVFAAEDPDAVIDDDAAANTDGTDGTSANEAAEDGADTDAETAAADGPVDISDGNVRRIVIRKGIFHLEGVTSDQETIDEIYNTTISLVGPDRVVNELTVDPSSPTDTINTPVFIEDVILFDFNSVDVNNAFLPILDLGVTFLSIRPDLAVNVIAFADSVGSEEVNLDVTQKRADAVRSYMVRNGADPDRVLTDAKGESEAAAASDAEEDEVATERRVEFHIIPVEDLAGQNN